MNLIAIRDWLLLTNLVSYICPCLKTSNLKFALGGIIRLIQICAIVLLNNSSWEYDCNLTYGCDQYTTIMNILSPYKTILQHFCTIIVDGFNYLCQSSTIDALRAEHDARLRQLEYPTYHIELTIEDLTPEEPNHLQLYRRNHMHAD